MPLTVCHRHTPLSDVWHWQLLQPVNHLSCTCSISPVLGSRWSTSPTLPYPVSPTSSYLMHYPGTNIQYSISLYPWGPEHIKTFPVINGWPTYKCSKQDTNIEHFALSSPHWLLWQWKAVLWSFPCFTTILYAWIIKSMASFFSYLAARSEYVIWLWYNPSSYVDDTTLVLVLSV